MTLKSLRRQIGIVPQDTVLLSGHIAQNIAFGQTDFDIKDVEEAAKIDRKSTRLNSSHRNTSRMPSSA